MTLLHTMRSRTALLLIIIDCSLSVLTLSATAVFRYIATNHADYSGGVMEVE